MTSAVSADWVLPVDGPPIESGVVHFADGQILEVGPGRAERHFADAAIVPGFVNAHTHLEYAVYGGFGDGLADFSAWIALHVERKARLGWEDFVAVARLGAAESLAAGVTTIGDCSYSGAAAVAADELGLRAVVFLEVFGSEPRAVLAQFDRKRALVEPHLGDRVALGVSPHAPYSVSLDAYRACAGLGLPLATHLSESPAEIRYLVEGRGEWAGYDFLVEPPGTTGPRLLAGAGLLSPRLLAAHCVHVDPEEIGLLADGGAGVAHCPRSNATLGCGVAPLAELLAAGARVGLGTDSPASAPSLDVFEELRAATLAARARARRPDVLSAAAALELATLGGARALGLDEEVGSLVPGKRADLAVLSLEGSSFVPVEDPVAAVVFGGSPARILATVVDGTPRYERGTDWPEELRSSARRARSLMLAGPAAPSAAARP